MAKPVVLITGATSGIGRSAALAMARAGYRVFGTGRRMGALEALAVEDRDLSLETFPLDITSERSIRRAVDEVDRLTDGYGLDILVNNAGYGQFGPIEKVTDVDVREQFETNVFGLLAVTRAFLPQMRERGAGRVINVSSLMGRITLPFMGVYHATKYAVEALSDALRRENTHLGIRVILIEPGMIRTEFTEVAATRLAGYRSDMAPWEEPMRQFDALASRMSRSAPGTEVIDRLILKAARSRWPKARYVAPAKDRFFTWLGRVMPTRLVDWGQRLVLGLRKS